jgi:DNA-binding response OmpR family regulator
MARILIVEDDAIVSETLDSYLRHAGYEVERAIDGIHGLQRAQDPGIAMVILDLMVPGLSGIEICRRLRVQSTVPILMLTARSSEDDRVRGLQLGADDYVAKPFSPREVVARVQALFRRSGTAAPANHDRQTMAAGHLTLDLWGHAVRMGDHSVALTPSEFRLLESLMQQPGRALTRAMLIARTFGPGYDGADRTVDTHVTNLRRKLDTIGASGVIVTVHGIGYRLQISGEGGD